MLHWSKTSRSRNCLVDLDKFSQNERSVTFLTEPTRFLTRKFSTKEMTYLPLTLEKTNLKFVLTFLIDGKGGGGGGATVAVSPVTVTQTGSTILGADIKLQCDFKTLANPESIFWFQGNDIVYANQGNMSFVSTRLNGKRREWCVCVFVGGGGGFEKGNE